jgi:hypothetical protein
MITWPEALPVDWSKGSLSIFSGNRIEAAASAGDLFIALDSMHADGPLFNLVVVACPPFVVDVKERVFSAFGGRCIH